MPEGDGVDPAFAALLADPRMAMRRCPPHVPFAAMRAAVNRFQSAAVGPPIVAVEDHAGPVPVRLYRPTTARAPLILFAHGGGFLFGDLDTHDALCRTLARESGAALAAVAYRLAPETAFPAPLEDMAAALTWLEREQDRLGIDASCVAIAGDSAGGQIAAAATLAAPRRFRHLGLFYPLLDPAADSASSTALGDGYMLTDEFIRWAWEAYGAGDADRADPRYDLTRADPADFPPTTIVTAAFDPLRDEGEAFGARLAAMGIDVEVRRFAGMIHGFAGMPHLTPQADLAIALMGRRIGAALLD